MRIIVPTPDHPRHIGKRLASVLDVPLTRGYVLAANVLGYKSWDELLKHCSWGPGYFTSQAALPDSCCMPLAVSMRRQFQAQTLAAVAAIDVAHAAEIVAQVRPSDGFSQPAHPLGDARPAPRLTAPKIAMATHTQLSADLFRVWQVVGLQRRIAQALKEIALLLERFQLEEWPMNQFLYDLRDTAYGGWSPTHLTDLHRAPRLVSHHDSVSSMNSLQAIGATIEQAEIQGLEVHTMRLAVVIGHAQEHLNSWRDKSAPHDGEVVRFDGVQPIEDDGVALLRQHVSLTEPQVFLLSNPEFDLDGARRLLKAINDLDPAVSALKPVRWVAAKLRRGIASCDRRLGAAAAQRQPLIRRWDIWGIGAGAVVPLGTVSASTSMNAIAAAPGFIAGRVIAAPTGLRPLRYSQPASGLEQAGGEVLS